MISKKDLFFADFGKESKPITETKIQYHPKEKEDIKLKMTREDLESARESYLMNTLAQAKATNPNQTKGL